MAVPAHLRQQAHLGLLGPVGSLFLSLLHQGLVAKDGVELVAGDRTHEQPEQDRLQDEEDRVQDPGLLKLNNLPGGEAGYAFVAMIIPRHGDQEDAVAGEERDVEQELNEILLVGLADAIVDPRTVVVHSSDAASTNPTMVSSWRPVHFTPCADRPVLLRGRGRVQARVLAPLGMVIAEVDPIRRQRHDPGVGEHGSRMGHEQHDDDQVEVEDVKDPPVALRHCLHHDPPNHNVVGVDDGTVGHQEADNAARILAHQNHDYVVLVCAVSCLL